MTVVTPPALILVTGSTGFIGAAIIENLLAKGFSVRAVARSEEKSLRLSATFASAVKEKRLTFVVIPDLAHPAAFAEAIEGVEGIIHCAAPSPTNDTGVHPDVIITPTVGSTIEILEAASKSSTVKRVITTSSYVTLWEPREGKYMQTEKDWFDTAPKLVQEQGVKATGGLIYIAAKVVSERAAWKWVEENKPAFDYTAILPSRVWGKDILGNPDSIREGTAHFEILNKISSGLSGQLNESDYLTAVEITDVRDIAEGHVRALTTPEAGGERIVLKGATVTWQEVFDIINQAKLDGLAAPVGNPGSGKGITPDQHVSAEKAERILKMVYRPKEVTILDFITQARDFGWSP